jgi:formylglycine-generating enzyme required for sulfatase activity
VPKQIFKECAHCPEMVMVPPGKFWMGSLDEERGHIPLESPRHEVTITRPFAVSRFEITSEEWDFCVLLGGCTWAAPETGWGRGRRPVMNVNWNDAQQYVAWLAWRTGKPYRLLSEAEWEYAARAGSDKAYPWGDGVGRNRANCNGCSGPRDLTGTEPVGSFAANGFGLYDIHGNVFEWTQDCFHNSYNGAAADGSPWETGGTCEGHMVRGGSWDAPPEDMRSAKRLWITSNKRFNFLGLRVGRTLER